MTASEDAKMKTENSPESPNKESRKSAKPIMEKRRRARINASLSELKALLLEVLKKEGSRHSKMEKADILEMTVKHLKNIQRQQFSVAVSSDPSTLNKYHAGFSECATEVSRYLSTIDGVDVELRTRLLNHLARRVQNTPPSSQGLPVSSASACLPVNVQTSYQLSNMELNPSTVGTYQQGHAVSHIRQNQANVVVSSDQAKVFSGIQIVPARLPTGELSFVVPGNVLGGNQTPSYVIPVYASPAVGSPSAPSNCSVATAPQPVPKTSPIQQSSVTPIRPAAPTENVLNISAPFLMLPSNISPQQMFGSSPPPLLERKQVWRPW